MIRELLTAYDDNTQADGNLSVDLESLRSWEFHQVQIEIVNGATPTGGILYIDGRTPGATSYQNIGSIDMTGTDLIAVSSGVCFDSILLRPLGFDSGLFYNVTVYSKER